MPSEFKLKEEYCSLCSKRINILEQGYVICDSCLTKYDDEIQEYLTENKGNSFHDWISLKKEELIN